MRGEAVKKRKGGGGGGVCLRADHGMRRGCVGKLVDWWSALHPGRFPDYISTGQGSDW